MDRPGSNFQKPHFETNSVTKQKPFDTLTRSSGPVHVFISNKYGSYYTRRSIKMITYSFFTMTARKNFPFLKANITEFFCNTHTVVIFTVLNQTSVLRYGPTLKFHAIWRWSLGKVLVIRTIFNGISY